MILFFPFTVCDEILYILQQLECIQSVNSTHCSQLFAEYFGFKTEEQFEEKLEENQNFDEFIGNKEILDQLIKGLKSVYFVSYLRKLLKEFFQIKDEKLLEYNSNESKVWEKPIHRRQVYLIILSFIYIIIN
jgi:hypothetical protein